MVPAEFVKLNLLGTGIAPVVVAAGAGDMTGDMTPLLVLLVSVASVVVTVGAAVTTVVTLPLPILLVSIAPVVVTVGTEVTTVDLPPLPSDVVMGGKGAPAEVVARGLKELKLELLVEFTGMRGDTAALGFGPGLCCSEPDLFSIWLRWGMIAWGICAAQLAFSSIVNFMKALDFDKTVLWNLKGL